MWAEMKAKDDGQGDANRFDVPMSDYEVSKVGVCALTRIQQRQFDHDPRPDIIVNSVHPGYIETSMTKHTGELTIEEGYILFINIIPFSNFFQKFNYVFRCYCPVLVGSFTAQC